MDENEVLEYLKTHLMETGPDTRPLTFGKLPELHTIDFWAARDQQLVAWIEIKGRKNTSTKYPDTIVDASKWLACIEQERTTGLPAILFVAFEDRIVKSVRPTTYGPIRGELKVVTPSARSGSFNSGWPRPVVHVNLDRMNDHGTVPGEQVPYPHPQKTTVKNFGTPVTPEAEALLNAIQNHLGRTLTRMPHAHPLSHWIPGTSTTSTSGWVNLALIDASPDANAYPVDASAWYACIEHELAFPDLPATLAYRFPDGSVRQIRPTEHPGGISLYPPVDQDAPETPQEALSLAKPRRLYIPASAFSRVP